jgi:hypothetical protein
MDDDYSALDLVGWVLAVALTAPAVFIIARKTGRSVWLAAWCLIPYGAIIALAVIAFGRWPSKRADEG